VNPTPPSPSFGHSIIQDWGKRISPHKDRRETFVGNAGILQFFGNNDLATTVYVSRRLDSSKRVSGKPGAIQLPKLTLSLNQSRWARDNLKGYYRDMCHPRLDKSHRMPIV